MRCDQCGCDTVERRLVEDAMVDVCTLCDHVMGDDALIARVDARRRWRDLGVEEGIAPLVEALSALPGVRTYSSCEGHPDLGLKPHVSFRVTAGGLPVLERVLKSLGLINRAIAGHWIVEAVLDPHLAFTLKPKVPIRADADWERDIQRFQREAAQIADAFQRDRKLAFWRTEDHS